MKAPKLKCQICGSPKMRKAAVGFVCDQGHVQTGYIQEDNELQEYTAHYQTVRKVKRPRGPRKPKKSAWVKRGQWTEANYKRYLFFQCRQLILRHQIAALTELWKLPPEFEIICRDLWLLHLCSQRDPPPSEPWRRVWLDDDDEEGDSPAQEGEEEESSDEDTDSESDSDSSSASDKRIPAQQKGKGKEKENPMKKSKGADSGSASNSDSDDSGRGSFDDLLSDIFGSDGSGDERDRDDEDIDGLDNQAPAAKKKKERKKVKALTDANTEKPPSLIAILYLACASMKIPALSIDFIRLIKEYKLPYLDAALVVPADLIKGLSYHALLSFTRAPDIMLIYKNIAAMARVNKRRFDVVIPDPNVAPILWRAVRAMLGGPVLYALVKGLCADMRTDLSLHQGAAARSRTAGPPELILVCATVVVLKMIYGFDGITRVPRDDNDPALAMPTFEAYMTALQKHWDARFASDEELFADDSQVPVTDLSAEQIDRYLSFAPRALLPNRNDRTQDAKRRNATLHNVAHLFPLPSSSNNDANQPDDGSASHQQGASWAASASFKHLSILPTADEVARASAMKKVVHTATDIPIYELNDTAGAFPHAMELVLNVAARWACVDVEAVVKIVERWETSLNDTRKQRRYEREVAERARKARQAAENPGVETLEEDFAEELDKVGELEDTDTDTPEESDRDD